MAKKVPPASDAAGATFKGALILHSQGRDEEALLAAGVSGRRVTVEADGIARVDLVASLTGETYARAASLADALARIAKSHPFRGQDPTVVFDGLRADTQENEKLVAALWATYERILGISSARMSRVRHMQIIDKIATSGVDKQMRNRAATEPNVRLLLAAVDAWSNKKPGVRPVSKWMAVARYLATTGVRSTADRCEKDWRWYLKQQKQPPT